MTFRRGGRARVAIVAVSILVGTAACGSDDPGAERSVPVIDTSSPDTIASGDASSPTEATSAGATTTTSDATEVGISEAEVIELEQQLDEIDRALADLDEQLAQD